MYYYFIERVNIKHINKICVTLECYIFDLFEYVSDETPVTSEHLIIEEHGNRKHKKHILRYHS